MNLTTIAFVVLIIFIATSAKSIFGFGDALIAMPLIALVAGVTVATPLVALMGLTTSLLIMAGNWRLIDLGSAWRLIFASAIGIPVGLYLLQAVPESIVKRILGLIIIGFGLYSLLRPTLPQWQSLGLAYLLGFVAGVFGGAYNISGPPVVIYGTLSRWEPPQFRATLQGFFTPTVILIVIGHALSGLWTANVWQLYACSLPGVLAAILLGGKLNRCIPAARFTRALYAILIFLGLLLMI